MSTRRFDYEILQEMKTRWSPRAFDPHRPVSEEDIMGVLEAARYAPSCFNEQPWRYIVAAKGQDDYQKILDVLVEANREWAAKAPVLMMITSNQRFAKNDKENHWHLFDAGTSWGYLSLEAQRRGLHTHAMAGFNAEATRQTFGLGENISIVAAVAMGYYGNKEELSPALQKNENPGLRKPIQEILIQTKP